MIRPAEGDSSFLLDPDDKVANSWTGRIGLTNWACRQPNCHLFANERSAVCRGFALTVSGRMVEFDRDGRLLWLHEDPWQHHDARRLENGVIYAAFTGLTDANKLAISRGVAGSEADGGPFGEVTRQVDEAGHIVWKWHFSNFGFAKNPLQPKVNCWSHGHTNTLRPLPDEPFWSAQKIRHDLYRGSGHRRAVLDIPK